MANRTPVGRIDGQTVTRTTHGGKAGLSGLDPFHRGPDQGGVCMNRLRQPGQLSVRRSLAL